MAINSQKVLKYPINVDKLLVKENLLHLTNECRAYLIHVKIAQLLFFARMLYNNQVYENL